MKHLIVFFLINPNLRNNLKLLELIRDANYKKKHRENLRCFFIIAIYFITQELP